MRYLWIFWMVQYLHGFLLHHRSKQMTKETGARQEDGISSLEDGISSVPSNRRSLWCVLSRSSVEMSCKLQLHQNSDFRQYFNFLYLNVALRTLRVKDGYKWLPTHRSAFPNELERMKRLTFATFKNAKTWRYMKIHLNFQDPNLITLVVSMFSLVPLAPNRRNPWNLLRWNPRPAGLCRNSSG